MRKMPILTHTLAVALTMGVMAQSACARPADEAAGEAQASQESRLRPEGPQILQATPADTLSRARLAAPQACPRDMNGTINAAISATIGAVRGNNSAALLKLISPSGVTIGAEGRQISYATVSAQFAAKTGVYCDLFTCQGRAGAMRGLFAPGKTDTSVDTRNGLASVFINANTDKELDLSFKWVNCGWVITAMGGA